MAQKKLTKAERVVMEMEELAADMLAESGSYKIHNIGTTDGRYHQSPYGKFYKSLPRAMRAAIGCFGPGATREGHEACEGIVMYKAFRVILPKVDYSDVEYIDIVVEP